jgi:hypothetical protein
MASGNNLSARLKPEITGGLACLLVVKKSEKGGGEVVLHNSQTSSTISLR